MPSPLSNSESSDSDGDGIGDNADEDDDNDGVADEDDAFPNDPTETSDSDGDGIGDNSEVDESGGGLPGFGVALALVSMLIAGIKTARNGDYRTEPSDQHEDQRD